MTSLDIHACSAADIERFRALGLPGRLFERHLQKFATQQRGESVFFVAWNEDAPAGFVTLLAKSKYGVVRRETGDFPELNDLVATPQRQGIGTAIIRYAEDEARRHGASRVGLAVELSNVDARRLYERLGYSDWGNGMVVDRWHELDDEGTPTVEHEDDCFYLVKEL